MPKINTISKDTILDIYDMILGSNEVGVTKNFSLAQLTAFLSGYDGFGLVIVESQLDFTTAEPTIVSGLKYLNTTTGDSSTTTTEVTADYIYEATDDSWTPTPPSEGYVIWNRDTKSFLVYNGTAWVSFGGDLTEAEIKIKYENNADTNAFTDAEKTKLEGAVMNTGDETIAGVKTFSSSPIVPTPVADYEAANKKFVIDNTPPITLADVSANSTDATKSIYTMTDGVAVEFKGTKSVKINSNGQILAGGSVLADSYFQSTDNVAVLASGTTNGIVWLRPNGAGSGTGAMSIDVNKVGIYNDLKAEGVCSIGHLFETPIYATLDVNGGIRMADDTDAASADKVGTLKYTTTVNSSTCYMCMQTGASTYAWVSIKTNTW